LTSSSPRLLPASLFSMSGQIPDITQISPCPFDESLLICTYYTLQADRCQGP
jgi:hypothetical protein